MAESAQIQKMSSRHEAILQYIIANPTQKYSEVAAHFGVTPAWLSTIVHSHAFQDQLKRRHDELFDVAVVQPIGEKLHAAVDRSLEAYLEKVGTMDADQIIAGTDKLLGRLGFGGKGNTTINAEQINIQNNHVPKDVLEGARNRIGSHKVGKTDSPAALPSPDQSKGTEMEGSAVRVESLEKAAS